MVIAIVVLGILAAYFMVRFITLSVEHRKLKKKIRLILKESRGA